MVDRVHKEYMNEKMDEVDLVDHVDEVDMIYYDYLRTWVGQLARSSSFFHHQKVMIYIKRNRLLILQNVLFIIKKLQF